ncbi:succinyldiaminopimelate transaminase [Corynebacterium uropygiale]|uniref:Succinyldiaminopimelate transaminase n=1 Tax=Corynebacterium uropygiale TaxID=1775911 RepID=A0A9X1U0U9_9CORY|nr:succinyldiaminopimelate transaminase [Corynebacterium uropygiale]MCF4006888.1 succinyldiaminopimelate transaminase [Corynebacterium uropygiale]
MTRTPLLSALPTFPWDLLADAQTTAAQHPEGMINLSVGTPVDEVAPGIQLALAEAAPDPGYPQTAGTAELRAALVASLERRYHVSGLSEKAVLPVIGTKEAIAWLPTTLGLGAGDTVVIPELAYPTYEVGALLAGCAVLRSDSLLKIGPARPSLIFINSPSNPTGKVLGVDHLRKVVEFARERDVIIASDECYLGLGWNEEKHPPVSILDPRVCDGDHRNLLAIHSFSKTSNLAGYRSGFLAGDEALIQELLGVRKHAGLMMPTPVQAATLAAAQDDDQERIQKLRYAGRRATLMAAFVDAGFRIDLSDAGLYLWATREEDCWATVDWLAQRGILVAPGAFYGPEGEKHVRIGLTGSDEDIAAAARRLRGDEQ